MSLVHAPSYVFILLSLLFQSEQETYQKEQQIVEEKEPQNGRTLIGTLIELI